MSEKCNSQREHVIQYALDTYGTEPEYPWGDIPDGAVLRHSASKKWYGLIMSVLPDRLGLPGEDPIDILNVKCSSIMIGSLLSTKGFLPAYHMNMDHWISILLDGSVPDGRIFPLLDLSYDSVAPKRKEASRTREGIYMSIAVNLYYTGKNGSAHKFAEEMEHSGTAGLIRQEPGNLRYEYFFPMNGPETVLLIDVWAGQQSIDLHHASPMMETIARLREKYDLHMRVERYIADSGGIPASDSQFIRQ